MLKFRPVAQAKYQARLPRLGPKHGQDWDCNKECPVCEPYRTIERAYYLGLTDEEKQNVRFYKWGI